MNLAQNIERSQRLFPDKPALIFEGSSFTYRELNEMSNRIANGLSTLGISCGDRVALFLPNIPAFVTAYLGIQKIGAVPVSINSALKAEEVKYIIEDSGASILITTEVLRTNIPIEEISQLKQILIAEGEAKTDRALSELMANASPTALAIEMAPDDPAALLYTSGTTGFPKGAVLSHRNLVSNIRTFVDTVGTHPDDRILLFLPASHSYGQTSTLFPCLEVGATLVLHRELEIEGILKSIADNGVTTFFGVSTIYTLLYEKASAEQLRTIRRYVSGGAPLPLELANKWRDKFGVSINEEYGSTETSLICFNQTYQPGSVGSVLEGVELKLIDSETGQEVKPGELGEVLVRGPNVMLGYWNRPTETVQVLKEGWFHTGDIGRTDEAGYLYLVDRIKDMVNVGGLKVYPSEVENVLYQHPAVAEVAVYGVPEPLLGEQVIASIIPKSGVTVTTNEIVVFCRQNMADFKVPNLVELVDSLPKGRTGKILKKLLREEWRPRTKRDDDSSRQKSPESLKKWLSDWLETELALDPETIETDRAFADYGLNSTLAVVLAQDLSDWLERPIEPIITWNFPTIEQITDHLLIDRVGTLATETVEPRIESTAVSGFSTDTELLPSEMKATPQAQPEPIAIIGMGCRFPGGVHSPESLWHLLSQGIDTVTDIPNSRWNVDAYYDPNLNTPGKMYVKSGNFLEDIDQFDSQFFGIAPLEAASLDPQQRLLLEVSWEALEHAGLAPLQLRDSLTGVFVGSFWDDYSALRLYADDPSQIDVYRTLSNLRGMAAGRIAYVLGLQGPTMQLDTACSSSLLAVHLAIQSLRNQECHLALAGGVALNLSPELAISLCSMTALAPDGRCKTFDAKADGFGLGEGCGMVILKRFSEAIRDGDNIMAIIRGSAINHDGRSNGLTAPNGLAQEALIRQALANAAVKPNQIQYVETHGTGTSLGDPIEVSALANVLGQKRTAPLMIGSVKTNLGHLSSAAGIASLIKVVLSLQHAQIPPNLHFTEPNPHIPWDKLPLQVPTESTPWTGEPRLAGVNSFGMTGTNVHLLLEEAPASQPASIVESQRPTHLLTLSGKTEQALADQVSKYTEYFSQHPTVNLADVCYSGNTGRVHFEHRLAVIANEVAELQEKLAAYQQGERVNGLVQGQSQSKKPKIAFLFTGQGSQDLDMGRELYETHPLFRETMVQCDQILQSYLETSLLELLYGENKAENKKLLSQTKYTQPALFAIEYALAKLWQSWGIEPTAVIGHSVGEYAAACVAGVFSLADGLKLIAERGRLVQTLPPNGIMVTVRAEEKQLKEVIAPYQNQASLAVLNAPQSVVLSGEREAVNQIVAQIQTEGITWPLNVSHAFHSPLMEPMLAEFGEIARTVDYTQPRLKLVSNLSGELVTDINADYWTRHVRQPVRFAQGMSTLEKMGIDIFIEVGPKITLLILGQQCLSNPFERLWLPSIYPGQRSDWTQILESLAKLHSQGTQIDWQTFDKPYPRRKLSLPTYPFQRKRYWIDKSPTQSKRFGHPLLGQRFQSPTTSEIHFQNQISATYPDYLNNYRLYEQVIVPASAYLEMALSAGQQIYASKKSEKYVLQNISLLQPLVLSEATERTVQLVLSPRDGGYQWQIFSLKPDTDEWQRLINGELRASLPNEENDSSLQILQQRCAEEIALSASALPADDFGSSFQGISQLFRGENEALGLIRLPEHLVASEYQIHPVLLDCCLRVNSVIQADDTEGPYLPYRCEQVRLLTNAPLTSVWSYVKWRGDGSGMRQMDITLFDEAGQVVAELFGFSLQQTSRQAITGSAHRTDWLYELVWRDAPLPQKSPYADEPGHWLIVSEPTIHKAKTLAELLRTKGETVELLAPNAITLHASSFTNYRGVIYLAGQPNNKQTDIPEKALAISSQVLELVQRLIKAEAKLDLYLIVQDRIEDSVLWGLGRTLMWEHPQLNNRCIEMKAETTADALFETIWSADRENQIRLDERPQRQVVRLEPYQPHSTQAWSINKQSSYLITGGIGGIGLKIAEWLVTQGATHLVLSSRRGASEAAQSAIADLENQGAKVKVVKADVSQAEEVENLLQTSQALAPLKGIIHAAGVLDDGVVLQQTPARFAKAFAPKVSGSWYLHQYSQDIPLDFFVCFSSQSSLLGNGGQANYASANAFMDALMYQRQKMGLPALAINWGGWSEIGMAKALMAKEEAVISPRQGVELFGALLGQNIPQVGVIPNQWQTFSQKLPSLTGFPVLSKLIKPKSAPSQLTLQQQFSQASAKEHYEILNKHIKAKIEPILGIVPTDEQNFFNLGMDSLMSIQLTNHLTADIGISVSVTTILKYPTISKLSQILLEMRRFKTQPNQQPDNDYEEGEL